jgi:hypothetical protein
MGKLDWLALDLAKLGIQILLRAATILIAFAKALQKFTKTFTRTAVRKHDPTPADLLPEWRSPSQRAQILALRETWESDERARG